MSACTAREPAPPEVWVLGPLPPPVTGMTLFTEQVVRGIREVGPATIINWSPNAAHKGLRFRFSRMMRGLGSLLALLRRGRRPGARLYLVGNAASGLYITALLAWSARQLGYEIYLHHHVYSYIERYDWRMAVIDRCLRGRGAHIVLCEKMERDFQARYKSQCRFMQLLPSVVTIPLKEPRERPSRPFRLGHLSNLTLDKGLDVVLDTFDKLRTAGRDVRLDLAGPLKSAEADRLVRRSMAEHPDTIRHLGPVYQDDKVQFYSEIDAFLFPTKYRNESWGIVLHEAMAAGVPVITFERGCTPTVVGKKAGLVIERGADFASIAAARIEEWISDEADYRAASHAAIEQAALLQREGQLRLQEFVEQIFSKAEPATGPLVSN